MYDELVDLAKPGNRFCVTGIFRSVGLRDTLKKVCSGLLWMRLMVGLLFGSSSSGEGIVDL